MQKPNIATVVLDVKIQKPLDYSIPDELAGKIAEGSLVEVPLRNSLRKGTIVKLSFSPNPPSLKPIAGVFHERPLMDPDLMQLANWMADYYCCSLEEVIKTMLPSSLRGKAQHKEQFFVMRAKSREELITFIKKLREGAPSQASVLEVMLQAKKGLLLTELIEKSESHRQAVDALVKKGLLLIDIVRIDRSPLINEEYFPSKEKTLSQDQQQALDKINASLERGKFETHLLFGVTGSGKTEVYLQAISKALEKGFGTLMLVPEISLTAQTIERFRSRFEGQIAVLHHRLSHGERHDEWMRIQRGDAKIVIGARSAVFSPVKNLKLIIVDEEHEASYKQSDSPPAYHARDVAVMRSKFVNGTVILGSATPSMESYQNCLHGKYQLSKLLNRADKAEMPSTRIIDMRPEFEKKKGMTLFSDALLSGIEKRLKSGEKTILFLNRRGYHTMLLCQSCGHTFKCPSCDLSLTFHKNDNHLSCHLCGFTLHPPPASCPSCRHGSTLKFRGFGTEQVEKALYAIFPEIRVLRLDADTTKHKGSHQKLLREFRTGKADLMIGTQMIAKGLHFPDVTLVGVLNAEMGLSIPDFRASETTFQLLTQVSGRAGRGAIAGEVLIQTALPEHAVILHSKQQDFESFFKEESEIRKAFGYPPFSQIVKLRFSGKNLKAVQDTAENFRLSLLKLLPEEGVHLVSPSGHAKIKDSYRFQFLIRGSKISSINQAIRSVLTKEKFPTQVHLFIDVNPTSTFF